MLEGAAVGEDVWMKHHGECALSYRPLNGGPTFYRTAQGRYTPAGGLFVHPCLTKHGLYEISHAGSGSKLSVGAYEMGFLDEDQAKIGRAHV